MKARILAALLFAFPLLAFGQNYPTRAFMAGAMAQSGGNAIPQDNVSLYECETTPGEDTKGSSDLTNTGVVTDATAKYGSSSGFLEQDADNMTHATAFDYHTNQSFAFTMWVNPVTVPSTIGVVLGIGPNQSGTGFHQYSIQYVDQATDRWRIRCTDGSSSVIADVLDAATGAWHFIAGGYDADEDVCWLRVNENAAVESTTLTSLSNRAEPFVIGEESDGGLPLQMRLDQLRVYERRLTEVELDALFTE